MIGPTPLVQRLLEPPSYGFSRDGTLYKPSGGELLREFCERLNIVRTRKNWVAFVCWLATLALAVPLLVFVARYFSWSLLGVAFAYAMIVLGTHGTVYLHRYSTHRAFAFSGPVARFLCAHAVIKIVPEELYVVSHHVHHKLSDRPGDPYNAQGGFLYCFLADANHQPIARDLSESDYRRASKLLAHTGVRRNSYAQYQKWGSVAHPLRTVVGMVLNWAFWYAAFFAMGGHALATALFGTAFVWGVGVRTFNYGAHGSGKDARRVGFDFSEDDRSINQVWPGLVSGEWHSNHHVYPRSARAGFLRWQLDLAWLAIRMMASVGVVRSYRDDRAAFLAKHYAPYLKRRDAERAERVRPGDPCRHRRQLTASADLGEATRQPKVGVEGGRAPGEPSNLTLSPSRVFGWRTRVVASIGSMRTVEPLDRSSK